MQNVINAENHDRGTFLGLRPTKAIVSEQDLLTFNESSPWVNEALSIAELNLTEKHTLQLKLRFESQEGTLQIKGSALGILHPFCGSCGTSYALPVHFEMDETWCSSQWDGPLPSDTSDFSIFESGILTQMEPLTEVLNQKILEVIRNTPFCGPACVPHGFPPHQWSPSCHSHPEKLI